MRFPSGFMIDKSESSKCLSDSDNDQKGSYSPTIPVKHSHTYLTASARWGGPQGTRRAKISVVQGSAADVAVAPLMSKPSLDINRAEGCWFGSRVLGHNIPPHTHTFFVPSISFCRRPAHPQWSRRCVRARAPSLTRDAAQCAFQCRLRKHFRKRHL